MTTSCRRPGSRPPPIPTRTSSARSVMVVTRVVRSPCMFATPVEGVSGLAPIAYSGRDLKKLMIANAWEYNFSRDVSKAPKSTGMRQLTDGGRVSNMDNKDRSRL